jgi:hypothetical protein
MNLNIEIGIGEAFDRITILEIKKSKITDADKLKNIEIEHEYLNDKLVDFISKKSASPIFDILKLVAELQETNLKLWEVEDKLRDKERESNFDQEFIELARLVYITNDKRAEIKKDINKAFGSNFIEEKSYSKY